MKTYNIVLILVLMEYTQRVGRVLDSCGKLFTS